eukprot:3221986-Rhodomonas_salina.1
MEELANFRNLPLALLTLFRIATSDAWSVAHVAIITPCSERMQPLSCPHIAILLCSVCMLPLYSHSAVLSLHVATMLPYSHERHVVSCTYSHCYGVPIATMPCSATHILPTPVLTPRIRQCILSPDARTDNVQ